MDLLRPGETVWRRCPAEQLAWLIDGENFFSALACALATARHRILMVGWDFHSRVELRHELPGRPGELVAFLNDLCQERPKLRVHVLGWDYALLYALERETLPRIRFALRAHSRLEFELDAARPLLGSHHQKLVAIDDRLAFVGGFDVTAHRWDTRAHRAVQPERVTPAGGAYPPFHDVQVLVSGEAAAGVAEIARRRWETATGRRLEPLEGREPGRGAAWPDGVPVHAEDSQIGIARTEPGNGEDEGIREVERLYLASIRAARRHLYIENQYFTSSSVCEALAQRLEEPDGPEVVYVGPLATSGWLEHEAMGRRRAAVLARLREADRHGKRFRAYYPHLPELGEQCLNVHSKVMIVDDVLARLGSSNLSNRSMGLDTECDLALEATNDETRRAVVLLCEELVSEHLEVAPRAVREELRSRGSLIEAIESMRSDGRSLRPLDQTGSRDEWPVLPLLADPEEPIALEELWRLDQETELPQARWWRARIVRFALGIVALFALVGAWQLSPLREWAESGRLLEVLGAPRAWPLAPLWSAGLVALLSLAFVPITLLIVGVGALFGAWTGFAVAWIGSVVGAALGYTVGAHLWRDALRWVAGAAARRVSERLAERGIATTVALRIFPVAPFNVINLVAGASHVSLRDFVAGTAIGMAPGVLVLTSATGVVADFAREGFSWLLLLVGVLALVGAGYFLRGRIWDRGNARS